MPVVCAGGHAEDPDTRTVVFAPAVDVRLESGPWGQQSERRVDEVGLKYFSSKVKRNRDQEALRVMDRKKEDAREMGGCGTRS